MMYLRHLAVRGIFMDMEIQRMQQGRGGGGVGGEMQSVEIDDHKEFGVKLQK